MPKFNASKRLNMLALLASRNVVDNRFRAERERAMFLSLPYSSQAKHLRVCSIFRQTASLKHNIEVLIGWSVKLNTMRRLYRLNWPYAPVDSSCMQGMGSG